MSRRDGDRRGPDGASESVAEPLCRTADRIDAPRGRRPRDRAQRAITATRTAVVYRLLPALAHASGVGQGSAGESDRRAGGLGRGHRAAARGRPPPQLPSPRGLTTVTDGRRRKTAPAVDSTERRSAILTLALVCRLQAAAIGHSDGADEVFGRHNEGLGVQFPRPTHRFSLSFRDAEDLLAQRGITVTYETIRQWCLTFGPTYARTLRRHRGRLGDTCGSSVASAYITRLPVIDLPTPRPARRPDRSPRPGSPRGRRIRTSRNYQPASAASRASTVGHTRLDRPP